MNQNKMLFILNVSVHNFITKNIPDIFTEIWMKINEKWKEMKFLISINTIVINTFIMKRYITTRFEFSFSEEQSNVIMYARLCPGRTWHLYTCSILK